MYFLLVTLNFSVYSLVASSFLFCRCFFLNVYGPYVFQLCRYSLLLFEIIITGISDYTYGIPYLEGSVQRKLRQVWNCADHWVLAWDCNTGHYLEVLIHHRLVFNIFPFPVSKIKLIGNTIGEALRIVVRAAPILSFPLCCANTIGPAICTQPIQSKKTSYWCHKFTPLRQ